MDRVTRSRLNRAGRGYRLAMVCDDLGEVDRAYGDDTVVHNIALDGAHNLPWATFREALMRHYAGDLADAERLAYRELIDKD